MLKVIRYHGSMKDTLPQNSAENLLALLGSVGNQVTELIQKTPSAEIINSIFCTDKFVGTQIFCTHFSSLSRTQRTQAMKFLFFTNPDFVNSSNIKELGEHFLWDRNGPYNSQHHTFTYPEFTLAKWFHTLDDSQYQDFIDALPEFGGLDDWSCHNLFDNVFNPEYFTSDFSKGVGRLSGLFDKVQGKDWKRVFLEGMVDKIEEGEVEVDMLLALPPSNLLSKAIPVIRFLEGEGILGGCDDMVRYTALRTEALEQAIVSNLEVGTLSQVELSAPGLEVPVYAVGIIGETNTGFNIESPMLKVQAIPRTPEHPRVTQSEDVIIINS